MTKVNKLIDEKSPYLLQHSSNPVNWYPWTKEAFVKAKKEDKPIFLSIGYSTCHWCHVMAKESFADEEVAHLINKTFIPVKVDREERPDIDNIYMSVCQMMTGSGGWPLTIFMTPEKEPFYAGTYLPKHSKYNRLGLMELLPQINKLWQEDRDKVLDLSQEIREALENDEKIISETPLDESILSKAYQELENSFDQQYAGFGVAPKFPLAHRLVFLLHYYKRNNNNNALKMVEETLEKMRCGGIYDQIGYGFHRYATDEKWFLPHFEKMLYDQALLAYTYTEAYQITRKDIYAKTAKEIFTYVTRDMLDKKGGFYSAEDADSEKVEGKYYLFNQQEIREILAREEAETFIDLYNLTEAGNFAEMKKNILYLDKYSSSISEMNKARKKILKEREKRVPPHKDDKILTDWNGLMIASLARAAWVFANQEYEHLAKNAFNFIEDYLIREDGRLLHMYRDNTSSHLANINDYSFLIWGLIELYQCTFEIKYLEKALTFNKQLIDLFWDEKRGGFFFTPEDGEKILLRKKEIYDGAIPSANSIACWNLIRLAHLTFNTKLTDMAMTMTKIFSERIKSLPSSYTQFLIALDSLNGSFYDIIIVGKRYDKNTQEIFDLFRKKYIPNKAIIFYEQDEKNEDKNILAQHLKNYKMINNKSTVYLCENYTCKKPITELKELKKILDNF